MGKHFSTTLGGAFYWLRIGYSDEQSPHLCESRRTKIGEYNYKISISIIKLVLYR